MREMKTLTLPNGITYEIVDAQARQDISNISTDNARASAPPINQSASGSPIAINDSADRPLNSMRVFGRTTQVSTSGKQLINVNSANKTSSGITFTPNPDGSISISGTATAEAYYIIDNGNAVTNTGEELIASITGSSNVYLVVGYYKSDNSVVNDIVTVTNNVPNTFTYPTDAVTTRTFIGVQNGATVNVTVYPMVRLASITDDTYEPYSGGVTSPSLGWSQELTSIENPTFKLFGKNLIPYPHAESDITRAGITYTALSDGSILANGTSTGSYLTIVTTASEAVYLESGVKYFFSCCPAGASVSTYYAYVKIGNQQLFDYGSGVEVIPTASGYASISMVIKAGTTVVSSRFTPQIEMSESVTEFEPYIEPQTFQLSRTLPGIPVTSNGNYTDSNGQQWICDEIDFGRGVYVKRVKSLLLDGSMGFGIGSGSDYFYISLSDRAYGSPIMCDKLSHASGLWETTPTWWADNPDNNVVAFVGFMDAGIATTVDEMVAYTATNPITIHYILAVPIETELTEEEINNFKMVSTYGTSTTILNDQEAWAEVEYTADTRSYIRTVVYGDAYDRVDEAVSPEEIQTAVDNWLNTHFSSAEGESF